MHNMCLFCMHSCDLIWCSLLKLFICDNSVVGGSMIIIGLYAVTWASYRERHAAAAVISHDKNSYRINIFSGPKPSD